MTSALRLTIYFLSFASLMILTRALLSRGIVNKMKPSNQSIKSTTKLYNVNNLSVNEFHKIYKDDNLRKLYQIIDVREPNELEVASLTKDTFIHLPLSQSNEWTKDIEKTLEATKPTICLCHHGMRSLRVATFLEKSGFVEVYNLVGGIHEYATTMDTSIKTY